MLDILLKILIGRQYDKIVELYEDLLWLKNKDEYKRHKGRSIRIARKKAEEEERERSGRRGLPHYCKLSKKQVTQKVPDELKLLTTNKHDLKRIKEIEGEMKMLLESNKELSWNYLNVLKRIVKIQKKLLKETEKKKEKRRREEEIKKYGKH